MTVSWRRSSLRGSEQDFETIELENASVRATILPRLGGKVWSLCDKRTGSQWLWQNPAVGLKVTTADCSYDDNWVGGWEELFPNDAACEFVGRQLPDHGEWWSQPWQWQEVEDSDRGVGVRLSLASSLTNTVCEKWITLDNNRPRLSIRYRISNNGSAPLHFLFKQHLAVSVTPDHKIELPGAKIIPVDLNFSTRVGAPGPFAWPWAETADGAQVDLSTLPPPELAHREFVYGYELAAGWCGILDTRTMVRLRLHFDREVFPYTWMFMTFGGWRDLYAVVLEPCTNMPKDMATAHRLGQCAMLLPHQTLDTTVYAEFC
jgi:hypothetical protein